MADPDSRGYVDFPNGLEDEYFEQLTAEKRTAVVNRKGFTVYQWLKPRALRNEQLDLMVYGEALAGKLGWRTMTPAQWAVFEADREIAVVQAAQPQRDLFAAQAMRAAPATVPAPSAAAIILPPPAPALGGLGMLP